MCEVGDTVMEISFSCSNYRQKIKSDNCISMYEHWEWFDLMDNRDSVLAAFRKILIPVIGKPAADRMVISTIDYYNVPGETVLDEYDSATFEYAPYCKTLAYAYECFFMFNDSVWMPVDVFTDARGRILNRSDIPGILKDVALFELMPFNKIYLRAVNDPYMKNEELRPFADLHYSRDLQLFYYEIYSYSGELLEETANSWRSEHKHIFIDAHTGKILWRTKIEHTEEHSGCVISMGVEMPSNSLTGD